VARVRSRILPTIRILQECFSPEPGLILRFGFESQPYFLQPRHGRIQVFALEIDNDPWVTGRLTGLVDREGCVTFWTLKAGIAWEVLNDQYQSEALLEVD
jgi:hypothetical protein